MKEDAYPFHPRIGDQLARRQGAAKEGHLPYVYSDEIVLAVNAALATGRPLLLRGTPGSGKSTLARDVAFALGRRFDEMVITSRTKVTDFLWELDSLERLADATGRKLKKLAAYLRRGVLWRAFEPEDRTTSGVVVLLDEIDKADPDVPNDLLVPLGEGRFTVDVLKPPRTVVRKREVLIMITSNGERELPPAFLRRCACLTLNDPSRDIETLRPIAEVHVESLRRERKSQNKDLPALDPKQLQALLDHVKLLSDKLGPVARRAGTAEVLDALKACLELGLTDESKDWKTLTRVLLHKELGNPDSQKADPM